MKKMKYDQSGFTLIELMVVLVILGLLAGLLGPTVMNTLGGAKVDTANLHIKNLEQQLELYMLDVGRYPTTSEGLDALMVKPNNAVGWNGPYFKKSLPLDPWNRSFHYNYPGEHAEMDIYSLGKDDREGGTGEDADASNWGP